MQIPPPASSMEPKQTKIARFGLIDVPSQIRSSSDDLCKKTINFIHVYDSLQPFYHIDTDEFFHVILC